MKIILFTVAATPLAVSQVILRVSPKQFLFSTHNVTYIPDNVNIFIFARSIIFCVITVSLFTTVSSFFGC